MNEFNASSDRHVMGFILVDPELSAIVGDIGRLRTATAIEHKL